VLFLRLVCTVEVVFKQQRQAVESLGRFGQLVRVPLSVVYPRGVKSQFGGSGYLPAIIRIDTGFGYRAG
jgi:hypothetical protein